MSNDKTTQSVLQDKTKINKAGSSSVATSLLDKITRIKTASRHTLLVDLSGSMDESVYADDGSTFSKFAMLQDLMIEIPAGVTIFGFNDNVFLVTRELPRPFSGTDMERAFEHMKVQGKREIVLITDGMPNDSRRALHASKGLKIDIIYVGPQPRPKFLEELAGQTGGSFTNINLVQAGAVAQLESKVQLLLGN